MLSRAGRAAVLAFSPAAAAAVLDETVLLQVRALPDPKITYSCDDVRGCRYNLPATPTEEPFKLVCDDENGCHFKGVTSPPPRPQLVPSLPAADPAAIQNFVNLLSQVKISDVTKAKEQVDLQVHRSLELLSKIPEELKKMGIPGTMPQAASRPLLPDLAALLSGGQRRAPKGPQLADLAKLFTGGSKQGAPAPQLPDLAQLLRPPASGNKTGASPVTNLARLFAPPAASAPSEPMGSFTPDNGMCCVQGPLAYVQEKLAKLKASPLQGGYAAAEVKEGDCASKGYAQGPLAEKCFPKAALYMSLSHKIDPLSEAALMAKFTAEHGMAATAQGMADLCKP